MGLLSFYGQGVPENKERAVDFFRQAATAGHPAAQTTLAVLLTAGIGVSRDRTAALAWLRAAARTGDRDAGWLLGQMLVEDADADDAWAQPTVRLARLSEAATNLWQAARTGSADGQFLLGVMYEYGLLPVPVPEDGTGEATSFAERVRSAGELHELHADLLRQAPASPTPFPGASSGVSDDESSSASMASAARAVSRAHPPNVSPAQLQRALAWYHLASERGHANALFHQALMIAFGRGVPQDFARAATLFDRAATTHRHGGAAYYLGVLAMQGGNDFPVDYHAAERSFRLAVTFLDEEAARKSGGAPSVSASSSGDELRSKAHRALEEVQSLLRRAGESMEAARAQMKRPRPQYDRNPPRPRPPEPRQESDGRPRRPEGGAGELRPEEWREDEIRARMARHRDPTRLDTLRRLGDAFARQNEAESDEAIAHERGRAPAPDPRHAEHSRRDRDRPGLGPMREPPSVRPNPERFRPERLPPRGPRPPPREPRAREDEEEL